MPSQIIIIGGGPAGLMAAEVLASAGQRVTVYERKPTLGRKFLMAGRGGLNLTHSEPLEKFLTRYDPPAREFIASAIERFPPADLQKWCEDLGQQVFTGSSGRVFPKTMKSSPLLRAWIARLETLGVNFVMNHEWAGWDERGNLVFKTSEGETQAIKSRATLLALGGASWPKLGSDGSWTEILGAKNIPVAPLLPANCGFTVSWSDIFRDKFSGQPVKSIALSLDGQTVPGEIMISQRGLEGGAVYALSAPIRNTILKTSKAAITIDLSPHLSLEKLAEKLKLPRGRNSFSTWLPKASGLSAVGAGLLREVDRSVQTRNAAALAALIKAVPLTLESPFPIDRAISSAGGIKLEALNENFMLRPLPGVFAAGEMLDWDAPTGGYLLQACFATGYCAGQGMLKWLESP